MNGVNLFFMLAGLIEFGYRNEERGVLDVHERPNDA